MLSNSTTSLNALPYTSPSLSVILTLISFLILLPLFSHLCLHIVSAPLLGPILLGAIYSLPLADILPTDVQTTILKLGYLGLMLLIVQGGLEARLDILSSPVNLLLASLTGLTG